jgi:hypothetical protein
MNLRSGSFAQRLNRNMRHWFGTGSVSDRAPAERALGGARSLLLGAALLRVPMLYVSIYEEPVFP